MIELSEVERLLRYEEPAPGLTTEVRHRHRELLRAAVREDPPRPQRRRRRRWLTGLGVAAVVCVGAGGYATAALLHAKPDQTDLIRCFATMTTDFDTTTAAVDTMFTTGPGGDTSRTAASAEQICADMWARGELSSTEPYVTGEMDPAGRRAVPGLQACVLPSGTVGVFPDTTACARLGLPIADVT